MNEKLIIKMAEFDAGDPKRIQHYVKVFEFAHVIGVEEGLTEEEQKILDIASILHDIGIIPCEKKLGYCNGKLQESEGPQYAREMLMDFPEVTEAEVERICYLIGHHHTYKNVDGLDYQILLEADFLVNALEDNLDIEAIRNFKNNVFQTKTGIHMLDVMFGLV